MMANEKVISGFTHCLKNDCSECPYIGSPCNQNQPIRDALDCMLSYANHVLSINEVKRSDFVYLEFNPQKAIVDSCIEPCGVGSYSKDFICFLLMDYGTYSYKQTLNVKDYGIIWRCWRSKPTWNEMRNAQWITK